MSTDDDLPHKDVDDDGHKWLDPEDWHASVDQAVDIVIASISDEVRQAILDGIDLHFGLGMWIRNNFGMWADNKPLMHDCAIYYARINNYSDEQIAELRIHLENEKDADGNDFTTDSQEVSPEKLEELLALI